MPVHARTFAGRQHNRAKKNDQDRARRRSIEAQVLSSMMHVCGPSWQNHYFVFKLWVFTAADFSAQFKLLKRQRSARLSSAVWAAAASNGAGAWMKSLAGGHSWVQA